MILLVSGPKLGKFRLQTEAPTKMSGFLNQLTTIIKYVRRK